MWECHDGPHLPRKTTLEPAWKHWKRTGFAASRIDMATPQENQRIETRHAGASKLTVRARLPQLFTLCSFKIAVSPRIFSWTSKFAIIYLKIDVSCDAPVNFQHISGLPRNLHVVTTSRSPANAIRKRHGTAHVESAVGGVQSAAPATKNATHLLKTTQKYCACHRKRLSTRYETHVEMSQSATPATRNEATRRLKPPKVTSFVALPIGTAIRPSRGYLRILADGCGRLRHVYSEHTLNPKPPEWNRNPCNAFGKKSHLISLKWNSLCHIY